MLERLADTRGLPQAIVCDNGPALAGQTIDQWAHTRGVMLAFIEPGKPVPCALAEGGNGRFRDECLNSTWLRSITDTQETIEQWRIDYNEVRLYSGLASHAPSEFARQLALKPSRT